MALGATSTVAPPSQTGATPRSAVGLALTGEVADCFMLNWDKKYLEKLRSVGIDAHVYSRLKDDILEATFSLEKGCKYSNEKLVIGNGLLHFVLPVIGICNPVS